VREIKDIALRHLTTEGAAAISLRAIAREMGMTAGAIYGYFDTRDALVDALVTEVYGSVADRLEVARDGAGEGGPAAAILAVGDAYRRWAIASPQEFRLIYGDAVPGYTAASGTATVAEQRACAVLTSLIAAAWPKARRRHADEAFSWADFTPGFAALVRAHDPELPPAAVALALRLWGRLHGLVALEVYGHLGPQTLDAAKLFRHELLDLLATLGLSAP
jgi:AcrR family transcriptional regulator